MKLIAWFALATAAQGYSLRRHTTPTSTLPSTSFLSLDDQLLDASGPSNPAPAAPNNTTNATLPPPPTKTKC